MENRYTEFVEDRDVPGRYGLRKVYKNEFDRDPERYVLRIGYPDFPECPFGESFSVLGFDTAEQTYVGLVTSILRDSRPNQIPYQARKFSIAKLDAPAAATDAQEASVARPIARNEVP